MIRNQPNGSNGKPPAGLEKQQLLGETHPWEACIAVLTKAVSLASISKPYPNNVIPTQSRNAKLFVALICLAAEKMQAVAHKQW